MQHTPLVLSVLFEDVGKMITVHQKLCHLKALLGNLVVESTGGRTPRSPGQSDDLHLCSDNSPSRYYSYIKLNYLPFKSDFS